MQMKTKYAQFRSVQKQFLSIDTHAKSTTFAFTFDAGRESSSESVFGISKHLLSIKKQLSRATRRCLHLRAHLTGDKIDEMSTIFVYLNVIMKGDM